MKAYYIAIILLLVFYYIYMKKMKETKTEGTGKNEVIELKPVLTTPILKDISDNNPNTNNVFIHEDLLPINRNPNRINVETKNYSSNYILPELLPIAANNGHKTVQNVNKKCDKCKNYAKEYCNHYDRMCHGNEITVGNYSQTVNNSMFNKNNECGCKSDYVCELHFDTSKKCLDGTYKSCADNCSLFNKHLAAI